MSSIKKTLKKYGVKPSKSLGQNFLIEKFAIKKVLAAADLKPDDTVLEIGPGLGTLTKELAQRAKKVIAVEKDQRMVRILNKELRIRNVKIIQGDILKIPNSRLLIHNSYKVVANLPFYLTAPSIRKFLQCKKHPKLMVLIVQKEVAQRICSKPPKMNLLAISVQVYAKAQVIVYIARKSFWPEPEVNAAIIKITPLTQSQNSAIAEFHDWQKFRDLFFKIVHAGFSQPRKQLVNNLSKKLQLDKKTIRAWLLKNNIKPEQRAQTLSVEDWLSLTKSL